ncbi:serine hydrolase [Larkinella soli]|uniref:serine hydrolase n=1 Tax=Larkinella soli TaxID=1770527 RepID=UPI000FFC8309|nr:serine hydrolase [Larkinella soli]
MRSFLPAFAALLLTFSAPAQQPSGPARPISEKLDEYLTAASGLNRFNGSVLVARKGEVLLHRAYGLRDRARQVPHDTSSLFQVGSITKTFVGAVILQLQEEKKLTMQDKLSRFFPDFPNGDRITLDQLFFHTSGLYDFKNLLYSTDPAERDALTRPVAREWLVSRFRDKPLASQPGTEVHYTNSGYYLLGMIIEKVTGKPFETVVRERFLRPLNLTRTGFDFIHTRQPGKSVGYSFEKDSAFVPVAVVDSTVGYAAGGMYSSTGDLYRWSRVVQNRQRLRPESWEAALSPPNGGMWGYGWGVNKMPGDKKLIFQNGNLPGFGTYFIQIPQDDVTIILLGNTDDVSDLTSTEPIARDLLSIVYGFPYQLPKNRKVISVSETVLRQYVGNYRLSPDKTIAITLESGRLFLQVTGQDRFELFPESETDFFLKVVDAQLTFHRDAGGNVSRMVVHQGGDHEAKRM